MICMVFSHHPSYLCFATTPGTSYSCALLLWWRTRERGALGGAQMGKTVFPSKNWLIGSRLIQCQPRHGWSVDVDCRHLQASWRSIMISIFFLYYSKCFFHKILCNLCGQPGWFGHPFACWNILFGASKRSSILDPPLLPYPQLVVMQSCTPGLCVIIPEILPSARFFFRAPLLLKKVWIGFFRWFGYSLELPLTQ